jgi:hypothetical protein
MSLATRKEGEKLTNSQRALLEASMPPRLHLAFSLGAFASWMLPAAMRPTGCRAKIRSTRLLERVSRFEGSTRSLPPPTASKAVSWLWILS